MKQPKPEHLFNEILTNSSLLKEMANKAFNLAKLNQAVLKKLDPKLAAHCQVTNLRDGILFLTTPSPAFGHILRFSEIELLSALRQEPEWCGLSSIQSRVQPATIPLAPSSIPFSFQGASNTSNPHPKPKLSETAASIIQSSAKGVASLRLQEALLKLASRNNQVPDL